MTLEILTQTLGEADAKKLWSAGYARALPMGLGAFDLGGVLTAILYQMRWGYRRGTGVFGSTFAGSRRPTLKR